MRIRNGFVSNSSSSSFIVPLDSFKDVFSLADAMIKIRDAQRKEDFPEVSFPETSTQQYEGKFDRNYPVSFSTINYHTYIERSDDGYLVSTCNNTEWEGIGAVRVVDYYDEDNPLYKYLFNMPDKEEYLYLETGIIGKIATGQDYCHKCYDGFVVEKGTNRIVCPWCGKEKGSEQGEKS